MKNECQNIKKSKPMLCYATKKKTFSLGVKKMNMDLKKIIDVLKKSAKISGVKTTLKSTTLEFFESSVSISDTHGKTYTESLNIGFCGRFQLKRISMLVNLIHKAYGPVSISVCGEKEFVSWYHSKEKFGTYYNEQKTFLDNYVLKAENNPSFHMILRYKNGMIGGNF